MEHYLILARSITYAQRMQQSLARAGIRAQVFRAPIEMTGGRGCAYAVQVAERDLAAAVKTARGAGLSPVQIFADTPGGVQEVSV